jgi:carboxynorspermidine decarboxylase
MTDDEKGRMQYAPTYRIGGNSCLAGDVMGDWSFEKPLQVGDKIVFNDMIHYTMVKTSMFNGVKHPSIGIWREKTGFELVREFSYEDYRNRLS